MSDKNGVNKQAQLPAPSLVRRKSKKLMQALALEQAGEVEAAGKLYRSAAADEERIAQQFTRLGRPADAAINLVSAASCRHKAGERGRALQLLDEVLHTNGVGQPLKREAREIKRRIEAVSASAAGIAAARKTSER